MQKFDDTIPDKHGFTDLDIIEIHKDSSNWNKNERKYINKRYKELMNNK